MKDMRATIKILGIEIIKDRGKRKLFLSQQKYLEKVLVKFGMSTCKSMSAPLAQHFKL